MAILAVKLMSQTSRQRLGDNTVDEVYRVESDVDISAVDAEVADAGGGEAIPTLGDLFSGTDRKVLEITPSQTDPDDRRVWNVAVRYSNQQTRGQENPNPLDRDTIYRWRTTVRNEVADKYASGAALANSAGGVIQPPVTNEVHRSRVTIIRNEAAFDNKAMDAFRNTKNNASVTIDGSTYTAEDLLMQRIDAEGPLTENGTTYYRVTYEIDIDTVTFHDTQVPDRGLHDKNGVPILDADKEPVRTPWPLDGNGNPRPNATDTPATLDIRLKNVTDWTPLLPW